MISLAQFMGTMGGLHIDGEIWKVKVRKFVAIPINRTDDNLTRTGHRRKISKTYSPT